MSKNVIFFSQGQKVDGLFDFPRKKTNRLIILCHGFTSNKENSFFNKAAKEFCKKGFAVFRFDFRGSGKSEGEFRCIGDEAIDLISAINYVKSYDNNRFKKIGLLGVSLGAAVITRAGESDKDIPCVLINPAISLVEVFKHIASLPLWWYAARRILGYRREVKDLKKGLKEVELVGKYNDFRFRLGKVFFNDAFFKFKLLVRKVLFIQSDDDNIINKEITKSMFNRIKTPYKKLVLIKHGDHYLRSNFAKSIAISSSIEWFNEWLK